MTESLLARGTLLPRRLQTIRGELVSLGCNVLLILLQLTAADNRLKDVCCKPDTCCVVLGQQLRHISLQLTAADNRLKDACCKLDTS